MKRIGLLIAALGLTLAAWAQVSVIQQPLPSPKGQDGKYVTSDGTKFVFSTLPGGYVPDSTGHDNEFLSNDGAGALWAGTGLTYNRSTGMLTVGTTGQGITLHGSAKITGASGVITQTIPGAYSYLYRAVKAVDSGVVLGFDFHNSADARKTYGYISASLRTATAGAEDGALDFATIRAGTITQAVRITPAGNLSVSADGNETGLTGAGGGKFASTTRATSSAGAVVVAGGILSSSQYVGVGPVNEWTSYIKGNATTGQSYGLTIAAGTNASDKAFQVSSQDAVTEYFKILGSGVASFGTASPLTINSTTASTSTSSGAVVIGGGLGVGGAINAGGSGSFGDRIYLTGVGKAEIQTSDASGFYLTAATNGGMYLAANNTFYFRRQSDNASAMTLTASGNLTVNGGTLANTLSTNGGVLTTVTNSNAGTGAVAAFKATNGTGSAYLYQIGTGFSTSGYYVANDTILEAASSTALKIATNSAAPIKLYTNSTLAATFSNTDQSATFAGSVTSTGTLTTSAGRIKHVNGKTASYTIDTGTTDEVIVFSGSTGSQTITLTAAASTTTGRMIKIKNRASVSVTVADGNGGADEIFTSAAVSSITLNAGDAVELIFDGTYWNRM